MTKNSSEIIDRYEKCGCPGKDGLKAHVRHCVHIAHVALEFAIEAEINQDSDEPLAPRILNHIHKANEKIKTGFNEVGL